MRETSFTQSGVFGELQIFDWYTQSGAVSGEVVHALDRISWGRREARSVIDAMLREMNGGTPEARATGDAVRRLNDAVTLLNEQAGRLSTMAKIFKATL